MDRNYAEGLQVGKQGVALRKESVDRNRSIYATLSPQERSLSARRAWIEIARGQRVTWRRLSLSARRAWIEICTPGAYSLKRTVALRKESVDRNTTARPDALVSLPSLSARRAWIEIP